MNKDSNQFALGLKSDSLDGEFRIFGFVEKNESFPHAYCVSGEKIYFSTLFNNLLYEMDLKTLEYKEYCIPYVRNTKFGYRQAVKYENRIILIPERGNYFTIFERGNFSTIISKGNYSDSCIKQELLYLLDRRRSCIDIFNMTTCCYVGEYSLPSNTDVDSYYTDIILDNELLYVLQTGKKQLIVINLDTDALELIQTDAIICYGVLFEGKIYYTSTKIDIDGIYAFDIENRISEKLVNIDYKDKKAIEYYRFWNPKLIDGYIFFCPHEESAIISYCIADNTVNYINAFDSEAMTLRPDNRKAVYGIECFEDKLIIMPYYGNEISILLRQGTSCNSVKFPIDKHMVSCFNNLFMVEHGYTLEGLLSLEEYIGDVSNK